ncbi:MAG: ribonuclease III [Deltaproteobacteria bacterium]|nr:ribonuclease III [Deltaproteobacteria bacterium]
MRTVKPGKLADTFSGQKVDAKEGRGAETLGKERKWKEWNDFSPSKKRKTKSVYQKDGAGRFVKEAVSSAEEQSETLGTREELSRKVPEGSITPVRALLPRNDYEVLSGKLGYEFKDGALLEQALTHRSVLGFRESLNYERLEFLGDAVLDLAVADMLCSHHPEAREGELSKMRAALVNTYALAEIAKELGIGAFVKLGKGELSSGGAERPSILADVMEAIIGAIYKDSSFQTALGVLRGIFGEALSVVTPSDPKTELQEALHIAGSEPPSYLVEHVEGPEHAPTFVVVVLVDGEVAGRGRGATKKAAQQAAAAETLAKLKPEIPPIELKAGQMFFLESALIGLQLPASSSEY